MLKHWCFHRRTDVSDHHSDENKVLQINVGAQRPLGPTISTDFQHLIGFIGLILVVLLNPSLR